MTWRLCAEARQRNVPSSTHTQATAVARAANMAAGKTRLRASATCWLRAVWCFPCHFHAQNSTHGRQPATGSLSRPLRW